MGFDGIRSQISELEGRALAGTTISNTQVWFFKESITCFFHSASVCSGSTKCFPFLSRAAQPRQYKNKKNNKNKTKNSEVKITIITIIQVWVVDECVLHRGKGKVWTGLENGTTKTHNQDSQLKCVWWKKWRSRIRSDGWFANRNVMKKSCHYSEMKRLG